MVIVLVWLAAAKSLDGQFTALRREEELEKELERAAVKIPVIAKDGGGSASFSSVPSNLTLEPTSPNSTASK